VLAGSAKRSVRALQRRSWSSSATSFLGEDSEQRAQRSRRDGDRDDHRDHAVRSGLADLLADESPLSILSTVAVMALAIPAAYGLSVRRVGRWQDLLFFFISTKFMPIAASIIPVFLLLRVIGALDNLWALGVLYVGMNLPLAIWMMRSFFAEVPYAVVEAAQIDGASYSRELWRVSLPIVLRRRHSRRSTRPPSSP